MYSCNSGTEKGNEESKTEESISIKDCDDFLALYDKWVDDYIKVIDDYFNNPEDESNAAKYMELMQEAIEWSTKWNVLAECADNDIYKERFEKISNEVDEKLKEIGL